MTNVPVLIIGAGPTGLNLAPSLARRGVACRLITEGEGPGERSRVQRQGIAMPKLFPQAGVYSVVDSPYAESQLV